MLGIALILEVFILAIFALGVLFTSGPTNFSAESLECVQGVHTGRGTDGRNRGHTRGCGGRRHLHGVLVLGRLRDGAELRGGVARSEAHHSAIAADIGDWPRTVLCRRQLVRSGGLSHGGRHGGQGLFRRRELLPDAHAELCRRLGLRTDVLPDPHQLLCLRHGFPQHRFPLHVLAGTRRSAAASGRGDARPAQEPSQGFRRSVGAGGRLGPALRARATASTIRRDRPGWVSTRCLRCSARACCWCCRPSSRWPSSYGSRTTAAATCSRPWSLRCSRSSCSWSSSTRWSTISRPWAAPTALRRSIPYVGLAILAVGLIWGFMLKSANPKAYQNIGHMVNEG